MDDKANAQTLVRRETIESLDREFARLHFRSCAVIENTPGDLLYSTTPLTQSGAPPSNALSSVGENILRCSAAIEQTFGGITSNLWDDPFEWTLPEYLTTPGKVIAHLTEVEETRKRAFTSFAGDDCLLKHVATPAGETQPLGELLLETLARATEYQGQAVAALKFLSGIRQPGFII